MMNFFEKILELIGWLQIAASPLLIGSGIGALVYYAHPSQSRLVIAISIAALGLIFGVVLASKIYNSKKGTQWFLSRTMASEDIDRLVNNTSSIESDRQEIENNSKK